MRVGENECCDGAGMWSKAQGVAGMGTCRVLCLEPQRHLGLDGCGKPSHFLGFFNG